jgi:hypothetical protein
MLNFVRKEGHKMQWEYRVVAVDVVTQQTLLKHLEHQDSEGFEFVTLKDITIGNKRGTLLVFKKPKK